MKGQDLQQELEGCASLDCNNNRINEEGKETVGVKEHLVFFFL